MKADSDPLTSEDSTSADDGRPTANRLPRARDSRWLRRENALLEQRSRRASGRVPLAIALGAVVLTAGLVAGVLSVLGDGYP